MDIGEAGALSADGPGSAQEASPSKSRPEPVVPKVITNQPRSKFYLFTVDMILLAFCFLFAAHITIEGFWALFLSPRYFCLSYLTLLFIYGVIFAFLLESNGLYKRNLIITHHRQMVLAVKSILVGAMVALVLMAVINPQYFLAFGKAFLGHFTLAYLAVMLLWRGVLTKPFYMFIVRRNIYRERILIFGGDQAGLEAATALVKDPLNDFHVVGFIDDYKAKGAIIGKGYRNLGRLDDLDGVLSEYRVDEILVAVDHAPYKRLIAIVERCLQTGKVVRIYSDLLKVVAHKMNVELYADIPVVSLLQQPLNSRLWSVKRNIDLLLSSLALIMLLPLFGAIAAGIKLSSKGPVIFKQLRIGKNGEPFNFFKFRSMHMGNDDTRHKEYVQRFIRENRAACEGLNLKVFKLTDDPRIFKFGKFIRKTSLDEFPQFFNVLRGDMSLVGPRPCLPYEWECYDDWHKSRLQALPGCTGIWQALGRSSVTFEEMVILDLYYISNMTPWLDLKIILKTFPVIFLGKGGH